jgi:hypothetical protein
MPADTFALIPARSRPVNSASRTWLFALGGAVAGGCAVAAALIGVGSASALSPRLSLPDTGKPAVLAFGVQTHATRPRMLSGIGGETLTASPAQLAKATPEAIADTEILSPTALDRLSAGDCISLTTASGKKLSFRIVGARNAETSDAAASQNIDLAVSACAPSSDAVLKAVIESKDEGKQNAVQRNL